MRKHTPGPWTIDTNGIGTQIMICATDADHHRGYVATLASTNQRAEANARLIAAAPLMLETLQTEACSNCDNTCIGCPINVAIHAATGEWKSD